MELEISGKTFPTKTKVANNMVQAIIIEVGFSQKYGELLDFTEPKVIPIHLDITKVKTQLFQAMLRQGAIKNTASELNKVAYTTKELSCPGANIIQKINKNNLNSKKTIGRTNFFKEKKM